MDRLIPAIMAVLLIGMLPVLVTVGVRKLKAGMKPATKAEG